MHVSIWGCEEAYRRQPMEGYPSVVDGLPGPLVQSSLLAALTYPLAGLGHCSGSHNPKGRNFTVFMKELWP